MSTESIREAQREVLEEQGARTESVVELFIVAGAAIVLLALLGFVLYAVLVGIGSQITDLLPLFVLASVLAA